MPHVVILVAPAAGLVALGLFALSAARRAARRRGTTGTPRRPLPASVVHVLTDEHELREALERASRFEHDIAHLVEGRAARYESLLPSPAPAELHTIAEPGGTGAPLTARLKTT